MTDPQSPGGGLWHQGNERGGEQPLHDGDVPAGGLVDQVQLVHAVEGEQFVASLGPGGQAGAVLVEVDEVDVEGWLLHDVKDFCSAGDHSLVFTHYLCLQNITQSNIWTASSWIFMTRLITLPDTFLRNQEDQSIFARILSSFISDVSDRFCFESWKHMSGVAEINREWYFVFKY